MTQLRSKRFWLCLVGTIFLAAGVILLPRYFSRSLDLRTLNRVEAANRDDFSFLEPGSSSVLENVRALQQVGQKNAELELIASLEQAGRMNSDLLTQVYDQAMMAADVGYLQWIGSFIYEISLELGIEPEATEYWADYIRSARYYSLTYDWDAQSNTKKVLYFWYLRFSDGKNFDYYFLVNSVNYQIYYAELYNQYTDYAVSLSQPDYMEDWFVSGCCAYYGANEGKYVSGGKLYEKLSMVILNYEEETAYVEQLALPALQIPYKGISSGFQNVGKSIQNTVKE